MLQIANAKIDLDDALVIDVLRASSAVAIHIKDCSLYDGASKVLVDAIIHLTDVVAESATKHLDGGILISLPAESSMPLDRIEIWDWNNGVLTLEGSKNSELWFSWSIVAGSIRGEVLPARAFKQTPHGNNRSN